MQLKLSTAAFFEELQTAARVASTRSAVQALSGVQLHAGDDGCELRATDMEVGLRVPLSAEVQTPGDVVLPARLLLDVVRSLPGADVTLALRPVEQDVEILSGHGDVQAANPPQRGFPHLPAPAADGAITVAAEAFIDTVTRVSRSASRDETRPVLTGILVSAAGPRAADGRHRLLPPEREDDALAEALTVPAGGQRARPGAAGARRIAQQSEAETIADQPRQNQIVFSSAALVLSSRLIDGQFPNYRQLLPETVEHELRCRARGAGRGGAARQPARAEERATATRLQRGRADRLGADARRGRGQRGAARAVPRRAFEIGFNPEFLRDGLESVDSGTS